MGLELVSADVFLAALSRVPLGTKGNVLDTLWLVLAAGLVFLMQAGFMCLESGLTRSKNSINVAAKNAADFAISVALFWSLGYGLMFGSSAAGWLGVSQFFVSPGTDFKLSAFFLFQLMFCGTATTIVSGAVAERLKFLAYLIISSLCSGLVYPLYGHWVWNGVDQGQALGWLGKLGFIDFAGSTVVHSIGGWISLAVLVIIGPRQGRFDDRGRVQKLHSSNLPMAVLGMLLLWFGWLGFNGGSTLEFNAMVAPIILNTVMGGGGGMLMGIWLSYHRYRILDMDFLINGCLAGLVGVTANCFAISTGSAFVIGAIGAAVMVLVADLLEHYRIDDAVGAIPVHLGAGVWGTLALPLFGDREVINTGLSVWQQLGVQTLGIVVAGVWAFGLTYLVLRLIHPHYPLRVTKQEEEKGLNWAEHKAKTEAYDLVQVMEAHAEGQDLHRRAPVDTFTELGPIALRYNRVMDALQSAQQEILALNDKLKSENLKLAAELDLTRQLQQMILPKEEELKSIANLDISGFMSPAEAVGGDYYDVLRQGERIKISIGDVTGHGIESGVLMIMAQTAISTMCHAAEVDPRRFFQIVNRVLYENVQRMGSDKSMTLIVLDYQDRTLHISGQHEEVIVLRHHGEIERIDTIDLGFPVALTDDITDYVQQYQVTLAPGDIVVLYTDGITEAENPHKELFGIDRLCQVLRENATKTANQIRAAIIQAVDAFIGSNQVYDDITLVVIRQL
ncbi:MAG: ammonium transporter [Pseudanabaenaceae cyanobacterium SKYGB_i_bin29]|nr:ammonium transporter [Pseudanabaenaceae cyanobacterium SKYG29]MDW8422370.1 ammonium transporter [Pseudanabaenaceae cyanobacterium SKYGB_i_bin29]